MRFIDGLAKHPFWSSSSFRLGAPFLVWLFIFRDFLLHRNTINLDTLLTYGADKFFINNVLNGVIPLWDPFTHLGTPFYALGILGFFNPLIYLAALLVLLGLSYYDAFLVYIILNYWLGCLGFYCLAKAFIKNRPLAYLAYTAIMFSSLGMMVFAQMNLLLIFMPAMWFFFFLVRLLETWRVADFLGLTFSAMLLMTSYLPFHFVTAFLVIVLLAGLFYWMELGTFAKRCAGFLKKNMAVVTLAVLGVVIAATPLALQKTADSRGELVAPARHCNYKSSEECVKETLDSETRMPHADTVRSGILGERVSFARPFAHLDKLSYGTDSIFYLPTVCYLLILLGTLVRINRRSGLLLAAILILGMISLGGSTPVHKFLYDHIPYFPFFRNMFFFMVFLIPLLILLAAEQTARMMEKDFRKPLSKIRFIVASLVLSGAFAGLLFYQGNILWTTWAALAGLLLCGGSLVFIPGWRKRGAWLAGIFLVILLFETVQVFNAFNKNARPFHCDLPAKHVDPSFAYVRPGKPWEQKCLTEKFLKSVQDYWQDMLLEDTDGNVGMPGTVGRGVFLLSAHLEDEYLKDYVHYKFILYQKVAPAGLSLDDLARTIRGIKNKQGIVYISNSDPDVLRAFPSVGPSARHRVIVVNGPADRFQVSRFDVNGMTLTTDFEEDQFLVYTDSYDPAWQVTINGHKKKLYKANAAFKGIWLPKGPNIVNIQFRPWGGTGFYVFVTLFFFAFGALTLRRLLGRGQRA
jgi:hypothetical protein